MRVRNFKKIDSNEIKLGMRFSAPVFFDDGENMFLAEEKSVKQYHIIALSRWKISTLLTFGHVLSDDDFEEAEELSELSEIENLEELEELSAEEFSDLDEVGELEEVASV